MDPNGYSDLCIIDVEQRPDDIEYVLNKHVVIRGDDIVYIGSTYEDIPKLIPMVQRNMNDMFQFSMYKGLFGLRVREDGFLICDDCHCLLAPRQPDINYMRLHIQMSDGGKCQYFTKNLTPHSSYIIAKERYKAGYVAFPCIYETVTPKRTPCYMCGCTDTHDPNCDERIFCFLTSGEDVHAHYVPKELNDDFNIDR